MTRTIVLGLDGANWPLLEPWLGDGSLPNLAALREEATWGPLTSQLPPVTSPNWRCYATGRNPAKLGVFWWEIVDREQESVRHPNADDFHAQPLWVDLAHTGRRVAVLNFPSGYPPAPIPGGRFTAGGPGARDTGFAFPTEWESELRRRYRYRVHPAAVPSSAEDVATRLDEILSLMQSRFDVAFDLLAEGIDFLHITLFYINVLHHYWYQGQPSLAGWQLIDRNLQRLNQTAREKDYNLLLMSDHGCAPVDSVFFINTWLEQEGYLALKPAAAARRLSPLGIDRRKIISLARRLGLASLLRRTLPQHLQRALPGAGGAFRDEAKGAMVDWSLSKAVASGQGPIYLLLPPDHPDYSPLREEIASKLTSLPIPTTGQPVAVRVLQREEIYAGPFLNRAPDLVFEQGPGVHTSGGVGQPRVFRAPDKWAADNVVEGLFLTSGPDFASRGHTSGTNIVDLAPTILHLMGAPVPDDMDGKVLTSFIAHTSEASHRPVVYRPAETRAEGAYTADDEDEIAARLTALGYMD